MPSIIGYIEHDASSSPIKLEGGLRLDPPPGTRVERLRNTPDNLNYEPEGIEAGDFLIGGECADGSWWYELVDTSLPRDKCEFVYGGSFDRGDAVQLATGVVLPKVKGFVIEDADPEPSRWFPGRGPDSICVDAQGRAVFFRPFHAM